MNFFLQSTEYIITLKEKGFSDQGFYNEYDYICLEVYKYNHPEALEEVNNMQTKKLLCTKELR